MASRFWVGGTGTWDASDTTHWAATTGGAGGASVPGAADTVTLDGSSGGGTVTVNTNITLSAAGSLTFGAFTGTLDFATNNNSISVGSVSGTGAGARVLNMGSNTWTLTSTSGNPWNFTAVGGLTLNAGTSTILLSATATGARTLNFGGTSINNLAITNASRNNIQIRMGDAVSIGGTFALTNVGQLRVDAAFTVTGAWTFDGTQANPALLTLAAALTITVAAANTFQWLYIQNVTKAGAGSMTATNSFDGGSNTSVTITAPASAAASVIGS